MNSATLLTILVPASIVVALLIAVLMFRRSLANEEKRRKKNAALRKEILEHNRKGEATVLNSRVFGTAHNGEQRSLVAGKFQIKLLDTGEEYIVRRKELAVPLQYVHELKYGNVIPVYVHRDDPNLILYEFDRVGSALAITFRDP